MKEFVFNHATCTNVVDGDTMDVVIDIGFDFFTMQRLRLYGIDTPERGQAGYFEAKDFVEISCLSKEVQVITYEKDSFGRWLSTVIVNGESLNDLLIKSGLAKAYIP